MKPTDSTGHHHDDGGAHHYTPDELHNPDVAHEHSDVNVRAILIFVVGIFFVLGLTWLAMLLVFNLFEHRAAGRDPELSPLARPATDMPPSTMEAPMFGPGPVPGLLVDEPAGLQQFRQQEEQRLHRYGWVDQPAGVAQIPIGEAKRLLLERGLPARTDDAVDPRAGTYAPARGGAASGRTVTLPPD